MWLAVENGKILHFVIQARRFQHIFSKMRYGGKGCSS